MGPTKKKTLSMKIEYGVTRSIKSGSFVDVYFGEIINLSKDVYRAPGLLNKLKYIFYPPGWNHNGEHQTAKIIKAEYLKTN